MKKSKINLIIDVIMFLLMMAIIGIGFLTKYVLLTGEEKWDKFGENLEFYYLELDRHQWNDLHFVFGLILIVLLVLHILLHWKMVVCIFLKMVPGKFSRRMIGFMLLIFSSVLVFFAYFAKPEVEESLPHFRNRETVVLNEKASKPEPIVTIREETEHHQHSSKIEIMGSMTLDEISQKYNVPCDHLKQKLGIPMNTSNTERLGRIRRNYGFTMSDIEEIILSYKK